MPARAVQMPDDDSGQRTPCVSCLVIGIDAAELESAPPLAPGSLEGVQLLVTSNGREERTVRLVSSAANAGARIAILISAPVESRRMDEVVFDLRREITELRAAEPDLRIVIDADAFAHTRVTLGDLIPYVDAVVRSSPNAPAPSPGSSTWVRLQPTSNPALEELIRASLTPEGERVLLPVVGLDWSVLQDFSVRRPALVEVTGARRLTVGEILARYQAQQRRQDAIVKTTIATGSTTLLFEVPDFAAPITITADTTIFRGPDGTNIEERGIRVNGAPIAGGGAASAPELPLIEAERVSTPPLVITLDDAYRYALAGEEQVADCRCYVVQFEPKNDGRGLASGRAWIDTTQFTLRRLQTVQRDLRGAIVSSEQVDEFGPVSVDATIVWLPVDTKIFQAYEGAGFRTPIHRTINVRHYDINSPAFAGQLADAFASDNVMLRETGDGLRYLIRRKGNAERSVTTRGNHTVRSFIGGVLVDPNISRPLSFAGLSYVNVDLFGTGAQLNVFFGGVFGQASWAVPAIAGTKWQAHGKVFAMGAQYSDRVFRNGREQYSENLLQRPGYVSAGVVRPLTTQVRLTADYSLSMTALERTANTPPPFEIPGDVVDHGVLLAIDTDRGAWGLRGWWNPVRRQAWRPWGLPGTFDAATRDYQRYGAGVTRTIALRRAVSSRLQMSWMGGRGLGRFSRYGLAAFDCRIE